MEYGKGPLTLTTFWKTTWTSITVSCSASSLSQSCQQRGSDHRLLVVQEGDLSLSFPKTQFFNKFIPFWPPRKGLFSTYQSHLKGHTAVPSYSDPSASHANVTVSENLPSVVYMVSVTYFLTCVSPILDS